MTDQPQQAHTDPVLDLLEKPYHIVCIRDSNPKNPGWVAHVQEWPGCMTCADTWEELLPMMWDAMVGWASVCIKDGHPIPPPNDP